MFKLPTGEELKKAGYPYGTSRGGEYAFGLEHTEWLRTEPDAVVYLPTSSSDTGNEQLQVFEIPGKDCLFAVWHQDTFEGCMDARIMYSRSKDGQVWEKAKMLAGTHPGMEGKEYTAWYPYSIVTPSGRIYVFYTQEVDAGDRAHIPTGLQMCRYTDDCGDTWSEPVNVPRNITPWDKPEDGDVKCMFPIQNPVRLSDGRYICGFTESASIDVFTPKMLGGIMCYHNTCYFAVFENITEDPEPEDIQLTWLPDDPYGLRILPDDPPANMTEEPFVVQLPNGWLFVTLRSFTGCIQYSVSEDLGHTWREPKPMRFADGEVFVNPVVTPFICDYGNGEYVQLYYGRAGGYAEMFCYRDKVYRALGTFSPEDEQPIRFEKKGELYMAVDAAIGPNTGVLPNINLEASFTRFHGKPMLWYSDRKHYLLGKML